MKKRILCIILTLCMVMSLLPTWVVAQELTHLSQAGKQDTALQSVAVQNIGPNEAEVVNDLYEKISAQVSFIKLISDIEIGNCLPIDYEVTIDLNGHVLKMANGASGSVIMVGDKGHLTIIDNNPTAEHKFKVNGTDPWVLDETGGTEIVRGGIITGGTGSRIDSAGESNTVSYDNICGGGALIEKGGKLTMTGGNIVGCTVAGKNAFGGGVFVRIGGTFEMSGGSITGCTAAAQGSDGFAYGGGIRNNGFGSDVGHTALSGTAVIRDCHATGGNWLSGGGINDAGTLNISGNTTIIGCTAGGNGSDAMYVNGNNDSSVTGGTFYGSIADDKSTIHGITVTYHLNSNENYATQVVQSGDTTGILDPAKDKHTFDGWYKADGTKWDAAAPVTENLTLTGWLYKGVKTADEFTAAMADSNIEGIRLTQDITLDGNTVIKVSNGRKVILDLNGYVLDLAGKYISVSAADAIKRVENRLTIMDSRPTAEHKYKDDGTGLWVRDETGGDKLVKGGVITGGINDNGGAIYVGRYGKFIMNGGNIVGCFTTGGGGAVCIDISGLAFEMNGGRIMGCKADFYGGAVYMYTGTFNMNGGSITGCKAANGSGVYLYDKMNASGGTVDGTVVLDADGIIQGGGTVDGTVYITKYGKITAKGGLTGVTSFKKEILTKAGSQIEYGLFYGDIAGEGTVSDLTVTYLIDGVKYAKQVLPSAGLATCPDTPDDKTGYTFGGWNKADGTAWDYTKDIVTEGITIYAKWIPHTYTVTFDSTGGSEMITKTMDVTYGEELGNMPVPIRTGYFFCGWYDALVGGKCYGNSDGKSATQYDKTENCTLYAQWKINQYKITVKPENGEADIVIKQDFGTAVTAPTLTRKGYVFDGWDIIFPTTMPAEDITIKALWKDVEKPTGEIKIGENSWKSFLNNITFGLFFKDTQTVTITAADNSGETVKIEYLLSNKELTLAELENKTFTAYNGQFNINPDNEYIIYVKLTDKAGNTDYICSDGIVLDETKPVIVGIDEGTTYCESQTVTINEKYIDTVKVNGTKVKLDKNNQFVLEPKDGKQQIVVTDKAGNQAIMTVTVNDGHTLGEWVSNGNGTHTRKCTASGCTDGIETENCSGGKATCKDKAECKLCGKAYGEIDPNNHADIKHIDAKEATKEADGNIEYWHCEDCDKYYSDSNASKEITKAETVTERLKEETKSPKTGDSNDFALWIALLFISGGAVIGVTVISKKKKRSVRQ